MTSTKKATTSSTTTIETTEQGRRDRMFRGVPDDVKPTKLRETIHRIKTEIFQYILRLSLGIEYQFSECELDWQCSGEEECIHGICIGSFNILNLFRGNIPRPHTLLK